MFKFNNFIKHITEVRMMNRLLYLTLICSICICNASLAQSDSDILFHVVDKPVTVEEFRYIYEKNNGENADYSEESIMEYLDLYKKFKLKVTRARDLQVDTIKSLQKELAGYRKQLANSYLNDKEVTNTLVNEVIERMKYDREVSHIFLPLDNKASYLVKNEVKEDIDAIYARLNRGEDFAKVAKDASLDESSAIKGGGLGFYTAPLPSGFYAFENAMFNTPIGKHSEPFLSKMGYHIIKVHGERSARGKMEIAHILLKNGKDASKNLAFADSLYKELKKDPSKFKTFAVDYSEDENTASNGGRLGTIQIRQYNTQFEDAVFALKNDNDITAPFKSEIGWHIVQRINVVKELDEDRLYRNLKAQLVRDDRLEISKKSLIESIKQEAGLVVNKRAVNQFNSKMTDDFYSYKWQIPQFNDENLLSFNNGERAFTLSDFAEYCKSNTKERMKYNADTPTVVAVDQLLETYTDEAVLQYEEANLERKYPAFKALMREYEEGILLFETMKMEVWDRASKDSLGLRSFYAENKENYKWEDRLKIQSATIKTSDTKTLAKIQKGLKKKKSLSTLQQKFNDENTTIIIKEEQTVSLDSPLLKEISPIVGFVKTENNPDDSIQVTRVIDRIPAGFKAFNEAKGYIIADYQDHLENVWINDLTNKYPIKINTDVLKELIK